MREGGFEVKGVGGRMSTADSAGDGMLIDGAADVGMGDTTEFDVDGRDGDSVAAAATEDGPGGPTISTSILFCCPPSSTPLCVSTSAPVTPRLSSKTCGTNRTAMLAFLCPGS